MKYIILDDGVREIPVLFGDDEIHHDMVTALTQMKRYKSCRLVAAGTLTMFGLPHCSGKSETLQINSRGERDSQLIMMLDYTHGLKAIINDGDSDLANEVVKEDLKRGSRG